MLCVYMYLWVHQVILKYTFPYPEFLETDTSSVPLVLVKRGSTVLMSSFKPYMSVTQSTGWTWNKVCIFKTIMISTVYTPSPHSRDLAYETKTGAIHDESNIAKYSLTFVYEGKHTEFLELCIQYVWYSSSRALQHKSLLLIHFSISVTPSLQKDTP